jgi:hypothetical protein
VDGEEIVGSSLKIATAVLLAFAALSVIRDFTLLVERRMRKEEGLGK